MASLPAPTAPPAPDLSQLSTVAICYALGMFAAKGADARTPGRVAALSDELRRRGHWDTLLADLGPDQAAALGMLVVADKGQHWSSTGQRRRP